MNRLLSRAERAKYVVSTNGVPLLVCIVATAVWWQSTINLEVYLSWHGFSPMHLVDLLTDPDAFVRNYPSGTEQFFNSAPMHVYRLAALLGIPTLTVMRAMIALEIIGLIAAGVYATRAVRPDAKNDAGWLVGLFLIAGHLLQSDFGRWVHPYFGWTYNFAYMGIIIGGAAALRKNLLLAAMAIGVAISSHPILGLIGGVFVSAILLCDPKQLALESLVKAALVLALTGGAWLCYIALKSDVTGTEIPKDMYIALTKIMSYHWYPVDMGLFWERHAERLLPFLSTTLLLMIYLPSAEGRIADVDLRLAAGFAAMLVLTIVGIVLSRLAREPVLIKLALHRASMIYLIFSAFIIVPGLWADAVNGAWHRAMPASLALLAPFVTSGGLPLLLALILVVPTLFRLAAKKPIPPSGYLLGLVLVGIAGMLTVYWLAGVASDFGSDAISGVTSLLKLDPLFIVIMIGTCAGLLVAASQLRRVIVLLALAGFGLKWSPATNEMRDPALLLKGQDYMNSQLWARNNTPTGSVFMVEPSRYYGWREASARPSFGNVREWLYAGWIYDSRSATLHEGLRRLNGMGLDAKDYINPPMGRPISQFDRLERDLSQRYNSMSAHHFLKLREAFGIDYFVFDKKLRSTPIPMKVLYENASYAIGSPE